MEGLDLSVDMFIAQVRPSESQHREETSPQTDVMVALTLAALRLLSAS